MAAQGTEKIMNRTAWSIPKFKAAGHKEGYLL